MTRRGSGDERRWRRRRNLEPDADGSIHGEQPVEPKGRHPREKPSGHRHTDPQPPEDHGPDHDAGGADENPHTGYTDNPHAVTHSQVGAPSGNPHGVTASEAGAVANAVGAPSKRRDTRANQPAPANVAVGSEYRVKDEGEVLEVAADTDGDGAADTWVTVSTDPTHDHDATYVNNAGGTPSMRRDTRANQPSPGNVAVGSVYTVKDEDELQEIATDTDGDGVADTWKIRQQAPVVHRHTQHDGSGIPRALTTAADSRQQDIDNADYPADGTDDHVTVQNAVDSLPVGTK